MIWALRYLLLATVIWMLVTVIGLSYVSPSPDDPCSIETGQLRCGFPTPAI